MRKRIPFFWHIFPSLLLTAILVCGIIIVYTTRATKVMHVALTEEDLKTRATLLVPQVHRLFNDSLSQIDSLCKAIGPKVKTRFTIILPNGTVIGDSYEDITTMDNYGDRPEVRMALNNTVGISTRFSQTLKRPLMYVAEPVTENGTILFILRASIPVISISDTYNTISQRIISAGVLVICIAGILSILVSRRLSKPLEDLRRGAESFARGNLRSKLPLPNSRETAELASAMNTMARQLDERIRTITRQGNEQRLILASMIEGVIAVDNDEKIILINQAAAHMLGRSEQTMTGKWVQESFRNAEVQRFIRDALHSKETIEKEIKALTKDEGEITLHMSGTQIRGENDEVTGALAVLHNITDIKKLENIRRDFVANVSHELRTPLTSIKGFVETLLDGAMKQPEELERFLSIISNHVNRLNSIIDDLMSLSYLEKEIYSDVKFDEVHLDAIVKDAVEVCHIKAQQRKIGIHVAGLSGIVTTGNPSLLEQAIINLIDNAIKYSDENTKVTIVTQKREKSITIDVTDEGPGITAEHLPRLFERFYRIDKARSRKLGGTGLGLSIVKHIIAAHNGSVTVHSIPQKGSTFTIHLPLPDTNEENS